MADGAASVIDALFRLEVRRRFSARSRGDWSIPVLDADAEALSHLAPGVFAKPAVGLTEAVRAGRFGYASWSYLPPAAEALVVEQLRPLVEGRLTADEHLADLQAATRDGPAPGLA